MKNSGYLSIGITHPRQATEGDFGSAEMWVFLHDSTGKITGRDIYPMQQGIVIGRRIVVLQVLTQTGV